MIMTTFIEQIQPYINAAVSAIGGLVLAAIAILAATLRAKIQAWVDARTTESQREILHKLAKEAAALAESTFTSEEGPTKLDAAISYVNKRVANYGIKVSAESIVAAIEKAVAELRK